MIFDLGGVIWKLGVARRNKVFAKMFGVLPADYEKAHAKFIDLVYRNVISELGFYRKIGNELGVEPIHKKVWKKVTLPCFPERKSVLRLIRLLRKNGYKLALLSNIEKGIADYTKKRYRHNFDTFILSCDLGFAKPDKRIWQITLKKLKAKPEEAVFIDDIKEYVIKARSMGINAIQFKSVSQVKKELKRLGVGI